MKRIMIMVVALLVVLAAAVTMNCSKEDKSENPDATADNVKLETLRDKNSYAIGYSIGQNLKPIINDIDLGIIYQGMKDAAINGKGKMTDEELRQTMMEFQKGMMERQQEENKVKSEKNKADEEKFLAENAKQEGVKTLESGLQYLVLQEGTGANPTIEDRVKVHYRGTLLDGTEFDSSYGKGEPAIFPLKHMIQGWKEGIPLMKVGAKYKFFIPAKLAYGEQSRGPKLGPNSTLIFEVELLGIEPPVETPAPQPEQPEQPEK